MTKPLSHTGVPSNSSRQTPQPIAYSTPPKWIGFTPAVHCDLGFALRSLEKWPAAIDAYRRAVELDPQCEPAWQYLGWVQYRIGNWRASIEALEKSCKLQQGGTGDAGQWIVLALAHAKLAAQEGLPQKERGLITGRSPPPVRTGGQANRQLVACSSRRRDRASHLGLPREARELMGTNESKK